MTQTESHWVDYQTYLGVDIDMDKTTGLFYSCVWSEKEQHSVEILQPSLHVVKDTINEIVAYNFFQSLETIRDHFNHTGDFNRPEQNLENLRLAAKKEIDSLLSNIF